MYKSQHQIHTHLSEPKQENQFMRETETKSKKHKMKHNIHQCIYKLHHTTGSFITLVLICEPKPIELIILTRDIICRY